MAEFTVNPQRFDPYKGFSFQVKWDGRYVAGISRMSPLKHGADVVTRREDGDPSTSRKSPGKSAYDPITLERGVTHDAEFQTWANKVWTQGPDLGVETAPQDFCKDVTIELYNEAGQLVMAYEVFRCWPSEFVAFPELDAGGNAIAIQTLTLQNEGWERDLSVTEPVEAKLP